MKFLVMHINNQLFSFDIFTVQISSWNMILISNDFWHKRKIYNYDPYNVLLASFVLQGHIKSDIMRIWRKKNMNSLQMLILMRSF